MLSLCSRPDSPSVPTCYGSPAKPTAQRAVWRVPEKSCIDRLILREEELDAAAAAAEAEEEEEDDERESVSISKKSMYWDLKKLGDKLSGLEKVDAYGLLDLKDKRWQATPDELRKSYRRLILEKHPDKKAANENSPTKRVAKEEGDEKKKKGKKGADDEGEGEEEEDEEFKLLAAAWDLLGDESRRRQFDSIDFFNDSMPKEYTDKEPDHFYRLFGGIFARQAKFSSSRPVPQLGDAETPLEDVQKFYAFWGGFKSWRDFTLLAEHDVMEAGDREERRWMQRKNKNEVDRLKATEMKRLYSCVELAQEHDPRIAKAKAGRVAEKERIKAEKEAVLAAERQAKEDVLAAAAAEEAAAAAVVAGAKAAKDGEKAVIKREKEKLRSALKKARKELKALAEAGAKWEKRAADLEAVASGLPTEEIEALTATLAAAAEPAGTVAIDAALKKVLG